MSQQTQQQNPWDRGLFVPLGSAEQAKAARGALVIHAGGEYFDATPFFLAQLKIGEYITEIGRNPYNPVPLMRMQNMARTMAPAMARAVQQSPAIAQVARPLNAGMQSYLKNSQQLIQMRLKTSYKVGRAPKILVPISMSIAAGATLAQVQIRNPYLGASGGATGMYQFPWTITSFRTSNGESGALLPIRLTQFLIGGHDYVAASLAGLTYAAGGAPATQGWPAAAFAETKRSHWATEVQPWNVISQHGGGTGFGSIMTETGFLQVGVFNGGSQTYVDTYSVYCNATLCGNPFADAKWTQVDAFRKSFAPLALQAPLAMQLAGDATRHIGQAVDRDDQNVSGDNSYIQPWLWASRLEGFNNTLNRFLDSPPEGLAMGDTFYDAQSMGFPLSDGAVYG